MTQALLPGHQSVHPSIWIAFMWMSLIPAAPAPANPISTVGPSPRAAGASCSAERVKLPGTEVRRRTPLGTDLLRLTVLEGVLASIWTERNTLFFFFLCVGYGLITGMIKGSKLDWHVLGVKAAGFSVSDLHGFRIANDSS